MQIELLISKPFENYHRVIFLFSLVLKVLTSPPLFQNCVDAQTAGGCEGSSHVCPAGHGEQNDAPLSEYVPKGHASQIPTPGGL